MIAHTVEERRFVPLSSVSIKLATKSIWKAIES